MSIYRMMRKGIEFDADRAFHAAVQAMSYINASGLIAVLEDADRKFVFVTGDEPDIEEIAAERVRLAEALMERAYSFLGADPGDKGFTRITEAARAIILDARRSAAPAP
ncbi:hypothetical protein OIU34_22895 [Pararhizobium sp. BT-229]|uniref:hypothetical protein n=1 Tax=Pararhizobium sp. BT-229 TaxID=2986923 RepID=UPI0021F6B6E2|nr:hypothetical protein [Pararhizobium sp. BT-229]MCV9964743.1 hypothetical protein [Pararhizobium sp. BT-229]